MRADHPTLANGRYVVKRCVGRGGMGAVFLAHDEVLKGRRALKVLDPALMARPEARARFRTEAIAMSQLNHPNVIRVFDQGQEGLTSYIVMEYVAGGSLRSFLRRTGVLERDLAISLCLDVADGLHHAHERGVIHRDIKPDNILLDEQGAKLTDFGIASVWDVGSGLTRSQAVLGTPAFMSPEQRLDSKRCTPKADLYSLGATLFVLLSDEDPIDLYEPDARERLLEGIEPSLADIIRTAVQIDPDERFASAKAMAEVLEAVRQTPGAPRIRAPSDQGSPTIDELDLDELHRLWRSYMTPTEATGRRGSETVGMTFAERPDEGPVGLDTEPVTAPGAETDQLAPDTVPSRQRWPLVAALLVGVGLGGLALWTAQVPSSSPAMEPSRTIEEPAALPAVAALLAADPDRAEALLLARAHDTDAGPTEDLTWSMLHILEGAPGAAAGAMARAAAASVGRDDPVSRAIGLADATMRSSRSTPALMTDWEMLVADHPQPLVEVVFLLSSRGWLEPARARAAVDAARARHPEAAIFALLSVVLTDSPSAAPARMALLDAALAAHPNAPALIAERCRVLLWQGKLEAAREGLRRLEPLAPDSTERLLLQADLHALDGNEADRQTSLILVLNDVIHIRRQVALLRDHGRTLASVGRLGKARMIWEWAARESAAAGLEDEVVSILLTELETAILLGVPAPSEASYDGIRARIAASDRSEQWRTEQLSRLLFLDGVRAARTADQALALMRLDHLREEPAPTFFATTHEVFVETLALEVELASGDADPDTLLAKARSGSVAATSTCGWLALRARIAVQAGNDAELEKAAISLREGTCGASLAEQRVLALQSAVWLAEQAPTDEARDRALASVEAQRGWWASADDDLPLRAQILALSEP